MPNAHRITLLFFLALGLPPAGVQQLRAEEVRLQDYFDDPAKPHKWKKSISDGWRMQQDICKRRIGHHRKLYGAQVMAAVPEEPAVPADRPRQLLVLQMFFHDDTSGMQGTFLDALQSMAEKTGAFEIKTVSTLTEITRDELFGFDAVLVNGGNYSLIAGSVDPEKTYNSKDHFRIQSSLRYHFMFEPDEERRSHGNAMRQALLEFVNRGGGLIGIGGAPRSAWPAYRRMFGCSDTDDYGVVIGQKEPKTLLTDLVDVSPIRQDKLTSSLPSEGSLTISSGFFVPNREFFEESGNTALLQINIPASNASFRDQLAAKSQWEDTLPITWIRNQGEGRVFYAGFECSGRFMMHREIQTHLLAGIQYALGDLRP